MSNATNATMVSSSLEEPKGVNYRDYSGVPPPECYGSLLQTCRPSMLQTFPSKLHYLLTCAENTADLQKVISWQPHGRCFVVHNTKVFVKQVLPNWFMQSKLASFQRQLNLYGFRRFTAGPDKGGYYHELFLRNRRDLCEHIRRTKVKGAGHRKAADPETEPNFYKNFPLPETPTFVSANQSLASMLPPHVGPAILQQLPSVGGGVDAPPPPPSPMSLSPVTPPPPQPPQNSVMQAPTPLQADNLDNHTQVQQDSRPVPTAVPETNFTQTQSLPPTINVCPSNPSLASSANVCLSSHISPQPMAAPQHSAASDDRQPSKAFDTSSLLEQGLFQSPNSLLALRPTVETDHNDAPPFHQAYHNEHIIMDALRAVAPFYPDLLRLD